VADERYRCFPGVALGLTRYLGVPISTPDGAAIGTLCFTDSRSEIPLTEEDVRFLSLLAMRASAEVERERLMQTRAQAEREGADERRRLMVAVIHDLRQPLATMRTLVHLLKSPSDPQEAASCLGSLEGRILALDQTVDELMEYSRLQSGAATWRPESVDLPRFLTARLESFRFEAEAREVSLALELDPHLGVAEADPRKLEHIVHNLLANAVKFAAAQDRGERRVVLRAGGAGKTNWKLEVEDTGIGMNPACLRRLFTEGYRAPGSSGCEDRLGYPRGRGIGLAIVSGLCAAAEAEVEVRSRPGAGTRFTLTFPLRTAPAGQ